MHNKQINERLMGNVDEELNEFSEYVKDVFAATFKIPKTYFETEYEREYNLLLNSGMFWEFHPELSGNYLEDMGEWAEIYNEKQKMMSIGSKTAKNGFLNEKVVVEKFINWRTDNVVQDWLTTMGYKIDEIEYVTAETLHGYKTDVQVQVTIKLKTLIDAQNLQVKLVSNPKGFNQVDKRWVDTYKDMWNIPDNVTTTLKQYTGELPPTIPESKDERRMFTDELESNDLNEMLEWFKENKFLVVSDIMKGRGKFAAEWILVALNVNNEVKWLLEPMNVAMNYFSQGQVTTTSQGNIKIGRITVQRKGGDGGKPTANMLQFKLNPAELFYK